MAVGAAAEETSCRGKSQLREEGWRLDRYDRRSGPGILLGASTASQRDLQHQRFTRTVGLWHRELRLSRRRHRDLDPGGSALAPLEQSWLRLVPLPAVVVLVELLVSDFRSRSKNRRLED